MDALHIGLLLTLAAVLLRMIQQRRRQREILAALSDLAAGKRPGARAWLLAPGVSAAIERLAEHYERLAQRTSEEAFSLRAILSSMVEAVVVTDENRVIRMVNDSFRRMFHVQEDPEGRTLLSVLREAAVEEIVRTTIETSEPQEREISLPQVDSPMRFFAASAVPLEERSQAVNGAVVVFHDITLLRQLETVRREFVSNVSHELRTPLSIFHGYVENLIDDPKMSEAERMEVLEIMRKHSLRLNALLEDLLTLARLESRRVKFQPVPIDLHEFLEEFTRDWQPRFEENGLAFEHRLAPGVPELEADVMRVEQVLNNLLENAIKYTPAGGRIRMEASASETEIQISAADTGVGIPASDLPHIFERFYRVEKARSRETGGTGLGLSIVRHIMALHGGRVEAASTFGKGTTITVSFPRHRETA